MIRMHLDETVGNDTTNRIKKPIINKKDRYEPWEADMWARIDNVPNWQKEKGLVSVDSDILGMIPVTGALLSLPKNIKRSIQAAKDLGFGHILSPRGPINKFEHKVYNEFVTPGVDVYNTYEKVNPTTLFKFKKPKTSYSLKYRLNQMMKK